MSLPNPFSRTERPRAAQQAPEPGRGTVLGLQIPLSLLAGIATTAVWGASGGGGYWPAWVWLGVGLALALHLAVRYAWRQPAPRQRWVILHLWCSIVVAVALLAVWALAGAGRFWAVWPLLALAIAFATHALLGYWNRLPPRPRKQELVERVDELTRTRWGVLDAQAADLRRIERNLHDGAQARLVALTMHLGLAEERLADRPEEARLVRRAREEASAAIAELRDLARGIAPPVLADRGLAAAVDALGRRSAMPVSVETHVGRRPPPVVETAAYYVVAESLTNVAKHGAGAPARVALTERHGRLIVEVADDGPGGADANGGGLLGLRHRIEAVDGTLRVTSPPGGGTIVRAELPCGS